MDNLWLMAAFLGIIEGLTEFLPVSSTGHLILLIDLLRFKGPEGKVFEIAIQLGAILAICWLYRQKLVEVALTLPYQPSSRRFVLNLLMAFLPAAVIGLIAHSTIKTYLFSPITVSIMLIIGGIAILLIEKFRPAPHIHHTEEMDWKLALKIGFFQCLAMIPGTSRSGATIMGSLLLGLDRKAAAEFSFFLAIPTMFAATLYDLYKNRHDLTTDGMEIIAVGFIAAFITALALVRMAIGFISRHGFKPFAYYRILLGAAMLLLLKA